MKSIDLSLHKVQKPVGFTEMSVYQMHLQEITFMVVRPLPITSKLLSVIDYVLSGSELLRGHYFGLDGRIIHMDLCGGN